MKRQMTQLKIAGDLGAISLNALKTVNGSQCNAGALLATAGASMKMVKRLKALACHHGKGFLFVKSVKILR